MSVSSFNSYQRSNQAWLLASEKGPFTTNAVTVTYDEHGRMTGVSFGSYSVSYAIDGKGRITGISAPEGGYSFSYLKDGFKRTLVTYPNGVKETRGYDALTRMTNLVYKKWLTTLLSINYRHDNGDRRTNEVWSTGRNLTYGYDRAHQLTDVMSPTRASDRASYRYDKAGNPIRRTEMGFGVTNSFNNLNQIVSGIWTGGAITVAGAMNYPAGTVTVNNIMGTIFPDRTFEVTNVTVSAGTNVLTAVYHGPAFTNTQMVATDKVTVVVGNAGYTHDANGNLAGDQNFTYQYDLASRLTNVILKASNVSVLAISYDGLGRRIQVMRNGATTERYVYLPGSFLVLAILDGSNAVKEFYTHGPDLSGTVGGAGGIGGILCSRIGLTNMWLHADASGNIILATDLQGNEIGQYRYTPFGRLLNRTEVNNFRFGISSKEHDQEAGIIAVDYRCLHPFLGRFLQRDLIAESGGHNLYAFAGNAPPNSADYLGLIELEFNAFIPGSLGRTVSGALTIGGENVSGTWLPEPDPTSTWWFGTDNRGFGGGGARVRSRSRDIRPTEIGNLESAGDLFITESDFSKRIRRSPLLGNIQEPVPLLEFQERRAIPTQKVRVRDINPCKSQITVEAEGSYPFVKSAPKINYRVIWHLEVDRDTRKISTITAKGSHNQFPAYEALVDGKSIYSFFPPGSGPTVWNLGFQIKRFEASK